MTANYYYIKSDRELLRLLLSQLPVKTFDELWDWLSA